MKGLFFFITVFILTSCKPYSVIQFTNSSAKFSSYNTYKLANFKADTTLSIAGNELKRMLEETINSQMRQRNYQASSSAKPDLMLRYELIANRRSEIANRSPYPYGYGYYSNFYSYNFTESILLLELIDYRTGKLVWQGSLDLRYTRKRSLSDTETLSKAIDAIFETYKYQAGSNVPVE